MSVVGLDEAGVGPGFGSIWAAAVTLPPSLALEGLDDSKKMSSKKRDTLRRQLLGTEGVFFGLGEVSCEEVDSLGLGECRRLVFERALSDLFSKHPDLEVEKIIVDGTLFRQYGDIPFECVPKADSLFPCVSAASILAKTKRDEQVEKWCDEDASLEENYDIRRNKGYLTSRHVEGIKKRGRTPLHRRSYIIKGV